MADHNAFGATYCLTIEVEGNPDINAYFFECSGLGVRINYSSYPNGGTDLRFKGRMRGPIEYSDVTLRYGLATDSATKIWRWLVDTMDSNKSDYRKNVTITMKSSEDNSTEFTWTLDGAWPTEWRAAPCNARASLKPHEEEDFLAIESLTLVYEQLNFDKPDIDIEAQSSSR